MALYGTITVDLDNGVSSSARTKFNEELKKRNFYKHNLTTLWTGRWTAPSATKASAMKYARDSIDQSAAAAGITVYEAYVSISDEPPVEWAKQRSKSLADALRGY